MKKSGELIEKTEVAFTPEVLATLRKQAGESSFEKIKDLLKRVRLFQIVYWSGGHKVNGYLAIRKGIRGKRPCIIANRGGTGEFGSFDLLKAMLRLGMMADWGYVVIASQYSGCGGSQGSDDWGGEQTLADVLNLKKTLKKIPGADPERIGMYGGSRGGMMTYLCLKKNRWIKAAVIVAGAADMERSFRERPNLKKHLIQFGIRTKADIRERSAVLWAQNLSKKSPILMMHGTSDWRVSVLDSLDMSRKLYACKHPHRLIVFEGGDHRLTEHREEANRETRAWFDRFVRDGEALPNLKLHGD